MPISPAYRRLLLCYPRAYRAQHGPELLATLEETGDGFSPREALALAAGGLRTRFAPRPGASPLLDGLHLGLLIFVLSQAVYLSRLFLSSPAVLAYATFAAAVVCVVALLRGRALTALVTAVLAGAGEATLILIENGPFDSRLIPWSTAHWGAIVLFAALLVATASQDARPRAWSWALLALPAVPLAISTAAYFMPDFGSWSVVNFLLRDFALLPILLALGLLTRSLLWPLAATVHFALFATSDLLFSHGKALLLLGQTEIPLLPLLLSATAIASVAALTTHLRPAR
ncbi:hypothetical protein [Actinocorallia sp. A-T 12471]|uniref:hypothetical protein n=1 Tax=Actinocorallia sp. A-T 12471 TaxID=3089813 RepID=UPI0029CD5A44|nr:hypothetical protein [Actinocorallia sp. A-T 12471]MDX6744920.1 hypothetical protein [Actinocorallia sp. A-T 12471]